MPRSDRDDSRRWLREELARCGFCEQESETWVGKFSGDNITSINVNNIQLLVVAARQIFEAERQKLENDLRSEKRLRQGFLDHIKDFAGKSIDGLKEFANLAEIADNNEFGMTPKFIGALRASVKAQRDQS